jgi:hypothetical protein
MYKNFLLMIINYKKSFYLFIMPNDLIKLVELSLLVFVKLSHDELLCIGAIVHLLLKLLNGSLHPVLVIFSWTDLLLLQLPLDISPNLPHLEVGIHLDYLEFLLLVGVQIISCESYSVKNRKNNQSNIILLDLLTNSIY